MPKHDNTVALDVLPQLHQRRRRIRPEPFRFPVAFRRALLIAPATRHSFG